MATDAHKHFDLTAKEYDYWKQKNWYYYAKLQELYRSFIPPGSSVLDIGCGTGDILASVKPSRGFGIDISEEMIARAKDKHPALEFRALDIMEQHEVFDSAYVILADVLEHLEKPEEFMRKLKTLLKPRTNVIISVANPFWEPLLMLAEKLKMKMPEGPHHRMSIKETEVMFQVSGFKIQDSGYRLLIPKLFPGADWINLHMQNTPLGYLSFVKFWVLRV